ncbi:uncharacterized protein LOC126796845 [Argentina anserina]|uniref:uncharacterized protein LOC126796845 n=1 Tax=Argentina anserina TaxID=57926 RepID=UPI0021768C38|nr:uncharacterized protein LOC126796845 [Potentilla anserina]
MPGKNRISQKIKYHPFFDYSSDEFYDSDCYDSDDDFFYCSTAATNNDSKETGSDSSLSLEKLKLEPRKKLLVLGLNGLLVYRVYRFNKAKFPTTRNPNGRYGYQLVFRRPFAREFLEFCLERFEVAIWSCAEERGKVKGVLQCAIGICNRPKLSVVFDIYDCTESGLMSLEDKKKPLVFKRLEKMWNCFCGKYSASDTLLIDDQPYQALLNPPHTSIFMESYNPDNASDNALDPKGELGVYLDGIASADNVQIYVKENPFGLPAMSNDHPDWNFYSDVLRGLEGKE